MREAFECGIKNRFHIQELSCPSAKCHLYLRIKLSLTSDLQSLFYGMSASHPNSGHFPTRLRQAIIRALFLIVGLAVTSLR